VSLGLMPKSMGRKKFLKRLVFGRLVVMPSTVSPAAAPYALPVEIEGTARDRSHKVLYCQATLR
jgi:hypothetical protein